MNPVAPVTKYDMPGDYPQVTLASRGQALRVTDQSLRMVANRLLRVRH